MVCVCITVCGICGADVDSCEDRDRRGEFESCDGDSDDGGSRDGMGNGFSDACAEWDRIDQSEELAVSDFVRTRDRCFVALLLSCAADRRGFEGGADR